MACISREREYECNDLPEVLSVPMENEYDYCIDSIIVLLPETLKRQLQDNYYGRTEVKFCTRDQWDREGDPNTEYYQLVFFPMYTHLGEEIPHGSIVSHEDSPVNGNIVIEQGKIVEVTSNHNLYDYERVTDKTLEFAEIALQPIVDDWIRDSR